MKIELTGEQYRRLVELVYLGNWVINSHRSGDEMLKEYEEFEKYVYTLSEKFGANDLVDYDREVREYFPSEELDEHMLDLVDEYDDFVFWEELALRLGERDIIESGRAPNVLETFANRDKYMEEFESRGLDRVRVERD